MFGVHQYLGYDPLCKNFYYFLFHLPASFSGFCILWVYCWDYLDPGNSEWNCKYSKGKYQHVWVYTCICYASYQDCSTCQYWRVYEPFYHFPTYNAERFHNCTTFIKNYKPPVLYLLQFIYFVFQLHHRVFALHLFFFEVVSIKLEFLLKQIRPLTLLNFL